MDRTSLSLPGDQDQLIEAVADANRDTIVVLNTGGPVLMPWLHAVDGVLEAWYPGQKFGTAIAAVLFGDADPGGRLPVTFPASDTAGAGARHASHPLPGRQRRRELRRGPGRRLPLVRRHRAAAAVPVRLRPVLRAVRGLRACTRPTTRSTAAPTVAARVTQHLVAIRPGHARAVPGLAAGRAGAAQAAQGLHATWTSRPGRASSSSSA